MLLGVGQPAVRGARLALSLALAAIAAIAVFWFASSFFVLKDQNPRGSLGGPALAGASVPVAQS